MPHALTSETQAPQVGEATYGALITATSDHLAAALRKSQQQLPRDAVLDELAGYERFLRTAGHHVQLLADASGITSRHLRRFAHRLCDLRLATVPPSPWLAAASSLGAAHDLVASHLNGAVLRTPEAELITGPASLSACIATVDLLLDGHVGAAQLIDRYGSRRRRHVEGYDRTTTGRYRRLTADLELHGKATMWDLQQLTPGSPHASLDSLRTAVTPATLQTAPPGFERSMAALRLLGQLSFQQAHGNAPASPASLRDLALLGARISDPDVPLPDQSSSLGRVRAAHARDQLARASATWSQAGEQLTRSILGITKAPSLYRTVIDLLDAEAVPDPRIRLAVASALPRLGKDAAQTVTSLSRTSALLSPRRAFCATRKTWQPITEDEASELANRFNIAASRSHDAVVALRGLQAQRSAKQHVDSVHSKAEVFRSRDRVQGASR